MSVSSGKRNFGAEAAKLMCLTKLNKQTVTLLGGGLVFLYLQKYSAADLRHEQQQRQVESTIQVGDPAQQSLRLLFFRRED